MRKSSAKAAAPFSKEKVKEAVSILEVARKYSPQINERAKRPKIICPFHEDRHLGSCRIFTDTNTFKCEACGAHGDTLTLASGYLGIKPTALNELLEKIVAEFSIIPDTVRVDYSNNTHISARPPERLSPEEYRELLMSDSFSVPAKFRQTEFEAGEYGYYPCEYSKIYFRTLAVRDPDFHDWVICTLSRKYWLNYMQMLIFCQSIGFAPMEDIIEKKLKQMNILLKKGLIDKKCFPEELRLRNTLFNEYFRLTA